MSFLFGGNTPDYASMAQSQELARQRAIKQGTGQIDQVFSQFNPQFYQQRQQAYYDYAQPQLQQQYQQARNQMTFGLANRGLLGGSAAQGQQSALNQTTAAAQRQVADTGFAQAQQLQQQIENARNTLLGQLYQSADPGNAGQQAISTAAGFAGPSVFQPIGNAFSQFLNQYAQRQATPVYQMPYQGSQSGLYASAPVSYGGSQ